MTERVVYVEVQFGDFLLLELCCVKVKGLWIVAQQNPHFRFTVCQYFQM